MPTTAEGGAATPATAQASIAVIGGSGFYHLQEPAAPGHLVTTPFGLDPVTLYFENGTAGPLWFLPRHGKAHSIAPHEINYRANLWALAQQGVRGVIAVYAVGGITPGLEPGTLVLPDQLIDYTWGREHTYFSGQHSFDSHIDFTEPYDSGLRSLLMEAARDCAIPLRETGVYAATQGPRLETAAEVRRLARDGCDMVGMTGMPEAALARELGLAFAGLALVVNPAAGLGEGGISTIAMRAVLDEGMEQVRRVLCRALQRQKSLETSGASSGGNT